MSTQDLMDRMASYGVRFTGDQVGQEYHQGVDYTDQLTLREAKAAGGRISRVRLLTERWPSGRMADVSYIHATLPGGRVVPVSVGIESGALYGPKGVKARMIAWAKEEGVYAKGIGLLDEGNWSVLY